MQKKTIGAFIAALRKANGMTQRDLAERLNVSDKTVSRWERDDGAPDLALIPVIAEIFDVSCDELLRGERRPPAERGENPDRSETAPRGEKQRQHLLKCALSQYRNHCWIALLISALGFIAALVCNFAFLKAVLGFFLGAVFYTVAVVCQAIFVNKAFFSVEDAELDPRTLSDYKRNVIGLAEKTFGFTAAFLGFSFPLILADAGMGLSARSLLLWGTAGAAVFLLLYAVVLYFVNASLIRKGVYTLSERESAVYRRNHNLKRGCAAVLLALLTATAVGHYFATSIWGPFSIMEGTTFEDYDSFIAFMEQEEPAPSEDMQIPAPSGEVTWYDEFGNEISEEEARRSRLEDKNGNVVCEYSSRRSYVSLRYTPQDGTVLPITVCTRADLQKAQQTAALRHIIFAAAYCAECLAAVLFYFMKRARK